MDVDTGGETTSTSLLLLILLQLRLSVDVKWSTGTAGEEDSTAILAYERDGLLVAVERFATFALAVLVVVVPELDQEKGR